MKKFGLVVFILFVLSVSVFADVDKPRLNFGFGNDKFTYGISKNDDDQLTYSGYINFDFDRYIIDLNMEAYTDRGSYVDGKFRNGRLDGVFLNTTFQQHYDINEYLTINANRKIGLGMTGMFYFDFVQNFHHKNVGVEPVHIPYDWEDIKIAPTYGLTLGLNTHIGYLNFELDASYENTIYFISTKKGSLTVSFLDLASLEVGYQRGKNFSKSLTMDSVISSQKGMYLDLQLDTTPVRMEWKFYPGSGFGFGKFSVEALSLYRATEWKGTDIYIDHSFSSLYNMELLNASARVPLGEKLSYVFSISYVSGFPKDTDEDDSRTQRNYALYEAGLCYTPFQWYVSPFVQFQAGCGSFQVTFLNNTKHDRSDDYSLPTKAAAVADFRFGFELLPEGFVTFGNTSFKVQLFSGTHIVPWRKQLTELLRQDRCHLADYTPTFLSQYFGVGVSIGVDVPE